MPVVAIKKWAPKFAKKNKIKEETAIKRLEKLWETAKGIAKKETGNEENWPYVMTVFKRMTGLFKRESKSGCVFDRKRMEEALASEVIEAPSGMSREEVRQFILSHSD